MSKNRELVDLASKVDDGGFGHGQCRFVYVTSTECRLKPYNGNKLIIGGVARSLPVAGVPITNAGLSADMHRYVYAYWADEAIALEFSATGHSTHTDGVEIKTGDPSRTLVGAVATIGSNALFQDNLTIRYVASWFNRRRRPMRNSSIVNTSSTSLVNLSSSYLNFILWKDSAIRSFFAVGVDVPDSNTGTMYAMLDGSSYAYASTYAGTNNGNWFDVLSGGFDTDGEPFSETTKHYMGVSGAVSGGTMIVINGPIHTGSVEI